MLEPTPLELSTLQSTLAKARARSATLAELGEAHAIADRYCLSSVLGEIRRHMLAVIPTPGPCASQVMISLCIGIGSGLLTNLILSRRRK